MEGKSVNERKRILAFVSLLIEYGLTDVELSESIVFSFQLKTLAQLQRLQNFMRTKELQRIIQSIYNEVLSTLTNVRIEVTWDVDDLKKIESKLQGTNILRLPYTYKNS